MFEFETRRISRAPQKDHAMLVRALTALLGLARGQTYIQSSSASVVDGPMSSSEADAINVPAVFAVVLTAYQQQQQRSLAAWSLIMNDYDDDLELEAEEDQGPREIKRRRVNERKDWRKSGWWLQLQDEGLMEPSTRTFKRFRGSFRVPYPFFVELVELVKQRDWFPTGQQDAVGRPCIPVELKVSRTDCHDCYQEKRGRLHATTVSGSVSSCVVQQLARALPAHFHKRDCHRAVHAFEIHINKFRQRKKVSEGQKPKNSQNRKRAKKTLEFRQLKKRPYGDKILYKNLEFFDKIFVPTFCRQRFRTGEKSCRWGNVMFGHGFNTCRIGIPVVAPTGHCTSLSK